MFTTTTRIDNNGSILSSVYDTFDMLNNDYKINNVVNYSNKILAGQTYTFDVLNAVQSIDATFINFALRDIDFDATINNNRFIVTIDSNILGEFSQFMLNNIANLSCNSLAIDVINPSVDVILDITIGTK